MLRKENGVTMTILVVTIIVLLILASVIMALNLNLNKTVDLKEITSNLELIKMTASDYRTKYLENEDPDNPSGNFPGEHCDEGNIIGDLLIYSGQEGAISKYWYKIDKEALKEMNLDITLKDNEAYLVDYSSLNVAYIKDENQKDENNCYKGILKKDGNYAYFYNEIKNLKTDDIAD